jgi:hypothetical protein
MNASGGGNGNAVTQFFSSNLGNHSLLSSGPLNHPILSGNHMLGGGPTGLQPFKPTVTTAVTTP